MKNKKWKACMCMLLSVLGSACKSDTDFISYGCSGGFTGGGNGVKIVRDGNVYKWSSTPGKVVEKALRTDVKFTSEAFSRLDKLEISTLKYNEVGNFTCTLTTQQSGNSHVISWINNQDKSIKNIIEFSQWLEKKAINN